MRLLIASEDGRRKRVFGERWRSGKNESFKVVGLHGVPWWGKAIFQHYGVFGLCITIRLCYWTGVLDRVGMFRYGGATMGRDSSV